MMLQHSIHDHTGGMPPMMVAVLNVNMDSYIDTLFLDKQAAAEAKAHWAEVQKHAKAD